MYPQIFQEPTLFNDYADSKRASKYMNSLFLHQLPAPVNHTRAPYNTIPTIEFFTVCTKLAEMAILYSKDLTTAKKSYL